MPHFHFLSYLFFTYILLSCILPHSPILHVSCGKNDNIRIRDLGRRPHEAIYLTITYSPTGRVPNEKRILLVHRQHYDFALTRKILKQGEYFKFLLRTTKTWALITAINYNYPIYKVEITGWKKHVGDKKSYSTHRKDITSQLYKLMTADDVERHKSVYLGDALKDSSASDNTLKNDWIKSYSDLENKNEWEKAGRKLV